MGRSGLLGLSLQTNPYTGLLCLPSLLPILLDTFQEIVLAFAMLHMFHPDIHPLLHQSTPHPLMHNDAKGTGGDIKDDTGATVIEFMGHTTLLSRVSNNIDHVTNLVGGHVGGKLYGAMVSERLSEEMASTSAITKG